MASRLELQKDLEDFLGSRQVYFQPPESIKFVYPVILYNLYKVNQRFADDISYKKDRMYSVEIIDKEPNIDWVNKMLDTFTYCSLDRVYVGDGLNHYSFNLFY